MNKSLVRLDVVSTVAPAEALQAASKIRRLLNQSDNVEMLAVTSGAAVGRGLEARAEPVTMTAIAIALLSSAATTAVINAIRAVHPNSKDTNIEYNLELADEKGKLTLKASNLTRDQATSVLDNWNALMKAGTASKPRLQPNQPESSQDLPI